MLMRALSVLTAFLQLLQHASLVLLILHINEVDNDNAAEIAQTQLSGYGLRRLQIGSEDGVFQAAAAYKTTGIHIHSRQRLRLIEDQITAGFKSYFSGKCFFYFVFPRHASQTAAGHLRNAATCSMQRPRSAWQTPAF